MKLVIKSNLTPRLGTFRTRRHGNCGCDVTQTIVSTVASHLWLSQTKRIA